VMRGLQAARWLPPPEQRAAPAARRSGGRAAAGPHESLDPAAQMLFDQLRALRLQLAATDGVPAYVVAHDRTLRELARLRPASVTALQQITGLGPGKIERYGAAWLGAIASARAEV